MTKAASLLQGGLSFPMSSLHVSQITIKIHALHSFFLPKKKKKSNFKADKIEEAMAYTLVGNDH